MASDRVRRLQLEAELAALRVREDQLQHSWAAATFSSSGTRAPEAVSADLLRTQAEIAEIEERHAELSGTPADAPPPEPAPALANPPAPSQATGGAEFLDVRAAAALLGTSVKSLEGMRRRGTGPAYVRHGKRVRYRRADLLSTGQNTVQGKPSKPRDGI